MGQGPGQGWGLVPVGFQGGDPGVCGSCREVGGWLQGRGQVTTELWPGMMWICRGLVKGPSGYVAVF